MGQTNGTGQIAQFPTQAVSDSVKRSKEYGLKVAHAIQTEWFSRDSGVGRFFQTRDEYHRLRLYARAEQSVRKYKDEMAINGDLSYLNLDWKPVSIIPKFVDIVVNGMQDRLFHIKAIAQDPIATGKRTKFVNDIKEDMESEELLSSISTEMGVDVSNSDPENRPQNEEELELYMQIGYKQGIEIAEEEAIWNVMMRNDYHEIKKQIDYDLVNVGIGIGKCTFNNTDGIKLEWVDPANVIYSFTERPDFRDCYYFGEVKRVKSNELKKEFPSLSDAEMEEIQELGSSWNDYNSARYTPTDSYDTNTLNILYFNWKTWENNVYKVKETTSGGTKALKKDDTFNPPKDSRNRYERVAQAVEVVYEGCIVLGTEKILKWEKATNMVRPESNTNKVMMNYVVNAPRLYKGRIESLVSRITTYADLIQLTHLKLQQTIQRLTPSGVYLDADGLAEIDLGNGTAYNPKEALNMYFQTGSVIGRSMTVDGDPNPGKIPIQELPGGGGGQTQILVETYNYYLNMIRDVTGLNEARDGGDPDKYSLVGVQKLAAANSNTATRHIVQASMFITNRLAELISYRFKDVLEYHPQKEAFIKSIGRFSVGSLEEVMNLNLHDFGIFLELEPDEEQKAMLEQNIQQALAKDQIYLEDAIDVREINNIKLANQLLKYRRGKKIALDQQIQQQNMEAQAKANGEAAQAAEQAKAQSEMMKTEAKSKLSQVESGLDIKKLEIEAQTKKELMQFEFDLNVKLKKMEQDFQKELAREQGSRDEKLQDKHDDMEMKKEKVKASAKPAGASGPPKTNAPKKSFESKGNDNLGGISLASFEPQ